MPMIMTSPRIDYFGDQEDKEDNPMSGNEDIYNLKCVPASRFKSYIINDIRKQQCKQEEECLWSAFASRQELNDSLYDENKIKPSPYQAKGMKHESMDEVDRELKRLKEDALPERNKRVYCTADNINDYSTSTQAKEVIYNSAKNKSIMKRNSASSTNMLFMIPEQKHLSKRNEIMKCNQNYKAKLKQPSFDHVINCVNVSKKFTSPSSNIKYNSSPELSTYNDSDKNDDTYYIRPDPLTVHKILMTQKKISDVLDEILYRLERIPLPDGEKDLKRRQQRVVEFTIRFSRNYLYELSRYVSNIQRHIGVLFPNTRVKLSQKSIIFHMQSIEQKLIAAHQLLLHALVAYCKHIPSSVLKNHPAKLKELLQIIIDLKDICNKIQLTANNFGSGDSVTSPLGKDTVDKCTAVLLKLKINSDNESQLDTHTTHSTIGFMPTLSCASKHPCQKHLFNKLSMYKLDNGAPKVTKKKKLRRCHQARKNYNNSGTDMTSTNYSSTLKHSRSTSLAHTPSKQINQRDIQNHCIQFKGDDIKTVMDMVPMDSDNGSILVPKVKADIPPSADKKSKVLEKLCHKFHNSQAMKSKSNFIKTRSTKYNPETTIKKKKVLENKLPSPTSTDTLMEFLQMYQSSAILDPETSLNAKNKSHPISVDSTYLKTNASNKLERLCDTQKGERNMHLIHIPCMDNTVELSNNHQGLNEEENEDRSEHSEEKLKAARDQKRNNILPTADLINLVVSDEVVSRLLKCRNEYECFFENNPMYTSNTHNKPWDIVSWISDKLVDELIAEISKEIQIDEVIQKLFELEFQQC